MVSPVCHLLQIVGPALVTSSTGNFQLARIRESRFSIRLVFFFPLIFTREATHVGLVQASAVVMLIHGLENVNGVCCAVCVCSKKSTSRTLFLHLGSPHAAVSLLGISGLAH